MVIRTMDASARWRGKSNSRVMSAAFMAGLSMANGISARLYVDALERLLPDGAGADA